MMITACFYLHYSLINFGIHMKQFTLSAFALTLLGYPFHVVIFASNIEIREVRNDSVEFSWNLPKEVASVATSVAVKVTTMKGPYSQNSSRVTLHSNQSVYTFKPLVGNTTYRISVEAFFGKQSLWYSSTMVTTLLAALDWLSPPSDLTLMDKGSSYLDISWKTPFVSHPSYHHVNQHAVIVYLFNPSTQQSQQVYATSLRMPTSRLVIDHLEANSVYNVTIKAGTDYGYGATSWIVASTIGVGESQILRLDSRTPSSLTVFWPITWLSSPQDPFTPKDQRPGVYSHGDTHRQKTTWATFSTLPLGEYLVTEARLAAETDTSVSIVFRGIEHENDILYEFRYFSPDGENSSASLSSNELLCPKLGCAEWNCFLFYNLPRNPRNYVFEIRANVDGQWNKWAPISRKPWNLMEKVCSITPPQKLVENVDRLEYRRKIVIPTQDQSHQKAWRYFIVVDRRGGAKLSPIDIPKLSDKATAEHERIPYYITAAFSQESMSNLETFVIGDGKVYGGYLNYPLDSTDEDPSWTIIPVSNIETEILERSRIWCGMELNDELENEISIWLVLKCIPFKYHLIFWTSLIMMILGCSVVIMYVLRWKTSKPKSSVTLSKSSSFAEQQLKVQQPFREKQHVKKHRYSRPKHTVPLPHMDEKYAGPSYVSNTIETVSDEESTNSLFYVGYEEPKFPLEMDNWNKMPKKSQKHIRKA
uniref:Fibronectin type-III domain-containing protein n=1 Tax=Acrobeloides nanus TaxID=290746 RepID=A0A914D806_9BILA